MKKLIYFDNAATSFYKPKCVIKSFTKALKKSANPGRSGHNLSLKNAIEIYKTRETIATHFNCPDPNHVIFTKNCTEALNLAILGLLNKNNIIKTQTNSLNNSSSKSISKPHVICSCFEHNSVLRPLTHLSQNSLITLTIIKPQNKSFITLQDVQKAIKPNTYLICITHISNVTGTENDITKIGHFCKSHNILFLVDCAQSAGHTKIDMQNSNINFLAFSGHKGFLSPQGVGALLINSKILPSPINFGGTGTDSLNLTQPLTPPESFESGTLMTPTIISLNMGIKYVEKHFVKHAKKTLNLTNYLISQLKILEDLNKIILYSTKNSSGVVAFNIKKLDSVETANILNDKFNIAVRSGLHCAPLTHKFLGTQNIGAVRVSLNFKNTKHEISKLIKAIKYIIKTKNL